MGKQEQMDLWMETFIYFGFIQCKVKYQVFPVFGLLIMKIRTQASQIVKIIIRTFPNIL